VSKVCFQTLSLPPLPSWEKLIKEVAFSRLQLWWQFFNSSLSFFVSHVEDPARNDAELSKEQEHFLFPKTAQQDVVFVERQVWILQSRFVFVWTAGELSDACLNIGSEDCHHPFLVRDRKGHHVQTLKESLAINYMPGFFSFLKNTKVALETDKAKVREERENVLAAKHHFLLVPVRVQIECHSTLTNHLLLLGHKWVCWLKRDIEIEAVYEWVLWHREAVNAKKIDVGLLAI
jgi:hypothetical protein